MKKILLLIILVLIANTYAGAVTIDGINYSFSDPEHGPVVAIVGSGNYSGHLIIPSSVTYQGQSIPVKTIGWNAFSGCNGLLSIAIPKSVSFLGLDYSDDEELPMYYNDYIEFLSFEGCDKLATISIDNDNTSYSVIDNCIVKGNHLVSMFKNGDIPDGITSIGRFSVYKRSGLSSITIPSSVEKIFIQSFINCKDLSSITILGSPVIHGVDMTFNHSFIIDYSEQVFDGCDNLKEAIFDCTTVTDICAYTKSLEKVTLMEGVTNIISNTNDWCEGERGAFERCTGLTSIIIPNSVTTIGDYAFYSCTNLASVVIGNSVTSIGSFAFSECSSMISLTIGNSVTSIGMAAFGGHSALKLKDVYCLGEKAPPGFDNLLDYIFDSNDVSNAILHVKDYAIETFKGKEPWTFFKEIVCDEKVTDFNLTYYVDNEVYKTYKHKYEDEITPEPNPEREEYTFSGWSEIPNVMPGKDVNVFGTFNHDEVILNGVTYQIVNSEAIIIDNANISGELSIPSSVEDKGKNYPVKNIPSGIFTNNSGITSLIIADGIISIGARAFSNCSSLTSISIPNSVTSIGERAFANIDKLTDVTCYANEVPQTDRTAFEKSYLDYVTLHVPYESLDAYNAVGPWKDFKEIVSLPRDSYTLTYMVDDETYKAITYDYGEEITAEATPMKEGYTFSGWSYIPATMPATDVVVMGTFTINKYTLTYKVDGEVYKNYTVEYGAVITPEPEPTKEGYTFSGWSTIPTTMPARNVTVTGTFTPINYTLTYKVDGQVYKTYTVAYGSTITPEPAPTKEGYSFSGWSGLPTTMPAHDVTVTGTFTINSYTLTYEVDGQVYKTYTVEYDAAIIPEPEPIKEGYTFSGWSEIPETMPAHNVTVTGTFTKIIIKCATPTISYANGKLTFTCETEGAICHSTITDTDIKSYSGNEVDLTVTYYISVYASKEDYEDSEVATGTLCWIDQQPSTEGIVNEDAVTEVKALPILIQSNRGTITVQGANEGTEVSVFSVNGMKLGSAIATQGLATISTSLQSGSTAIVKIGEKAIKVLIK